MHKQKPLGKYTKEQLKTKLICTKIEIDWIERLINNGTNN